MLVSTVFCWIMLLLASSVLGADVPKHILPGDPGIYYSGRVNKTDSHWYKFDWSGIEITYTFSGSSISVMLQDQGNCYNAFVDGQLVQVFCTTQGQQQYDIDVSFAGKHQLLITKRTEAEFGVVSFGGFMVLEEIAEITSVDRSFKHRLEFVGDSITCGYGNEGDSPSCPFSASTENNYKAWGKLVAEALEAEYYAVAWSGRGVVRNYGDPNPTSQYPFPNYYPHTLGNDYQTNSGFWDYTQYIPDAVGKGMITVYLTDLVFNLGTNDFSTPPTPSQEVFETGYVNFVEDIISKYEPFNPQIQVFLACGPMISDPCCSYVQNVVETLNDNNRNAHFINMQNILKYPDDYGCSSHPNTSGDQKMAKVAVPVIRQAMGW